MSSEPRSRNETRIRAAQTVRVVIWLIVLAVIVVFAALNTDKVSVDLNRPGFGGGSGYWFPTPSGVVCWAA
jgi:uncharacterized integral membrane protein